MRNKPNSGHKACERPLNGWLNVASMAIIHALHKLIAYMTSVMF